MALVASGLVVSRRTLQIVVLVSLVAFAFAYPLIESLDRWDAAGPASDSELQAIGVLALAGVTCLLTQLLAFLAGAASIQLLPGLYFHVLLKEHVLRFLLNLTASPPRVLRI